MMNVDAKISGAAPDKDWLLAVGHELRSTLQSLVLGAGIADRAVGSDDASARRHLQRVQANAMLLGRLVTDLVDAARAQRDAFACAADPIELSTLVPAAVEMAVGGDEAHPVRLIIPEKVPVVADGDRVREIVTNLLTNCAKYATPGELLIGVHREHARGVLWVRDGGPGISKADQARLFKRYARLPSRAEGLGVGLWLSREYARRMGGEMWVESRVGGPTSFFVGLPLAA